MKFICEKNTILKEIAIAQEIISSRNALSVLSNVLLETSQNTLTIKATDLKIGFKTQIPVETEEEGITTVFCDKLLGILRSLPEGDIEFEDIDEIVVIRPLFQKMDFKLRSISPDKFPELRIAEEESFFSVPQKDFIEMIKQTIFSVSTDETRFFMNGVYMEQSNSGLIMVATDGRRLSYINKIMDKPIPMFKPIIIPPKILNLITKLCSGEGSIIFSINDNYIFVEFDSHKIYSTLIEGQFPNYRRVVPEKQQYTSIIDKNSFLDALKRVSLLVDQKSNRLFLDIDEGAITLFTEENDIGMAREEIPCDYSGEKIRLAVNYMYMINPVKAIDTEQFIISFTEANKAITIVSEPEKDFFHIIMPMQLD
ncbi:MAG: DNA polymerase III subunit beta [Spirochaetales bacterium]|nr:DNA polymerase III subunit beta [Spirochaetales bacterium]